MEKNKKLNMIIIILIAMVILLAGALVTVCIMSNRPKEVATPDSAGVGGEIVENWDPNIDNEPTRGVDDAIIPGYGNAEMKAGDTTLKLSIGNPSENTVGLYATLIADDKELYRSPLLKPGQGVTRIPLNETLEKGKYDAYVLYQIVDLNNPDTKLNSVRSALELIVK